MAGGVKGKVRPPSDHGAGGFETGEWTRGYIGGETPGATGRGFGDVGDWDGDEGSCCDCDTDGHGGQLDGFSKSDRARGYKSVK